MAMPPDDPAGGNPFESPETPPVPPLVPDPPSKDACNMAMLAHLLGIFTGFIGPLIIWLIKKDDDRYVDDQGKEALNFQFTILIGYLISGVTMCFCVGYILVLVVFVVDIVFCVMATMAASRGEWYRYPMNIRIIK